MAKQLISSLPGNLALQKLNCFRQLGRFELSATVAFSALTGNLIGSGHWSVSGLLVMLAVLLLAIGCSALNQWQEQDLDARMERTRQRPLPAGNLSPATALGFAASTLISGLLLLSVVPGRQTLLLGLLAVIWYNAIYTPLKRKTPFAALPGAVCGALPPLIGWAASGHSPWEAQILTLAGTLFLWQIPHSWLLLCRYRQDLQQSGLPNLFERIPTDRLLRINNVWLLALALCYLQFPLFGHIHSAPMVVFYLTSLAALALAIIRASTKKAQRIEPLRLFHLLNLSMLLLLTTLIAGHL